MTPIHLTEAAKFNLQRLRTENDIADDLHLRIGVKGSAGCGGGGGFQYILGFDHKNDDDNEYDIDTIVVYINKAEGLYLLGMTIDWLEEDDTAGFVFNNPQAKSSEGNNFSI